MEIGAVAGAVTGLAAAIAVVLLKRRKGATRVSAEMRHLSISTSNLMAMPEDERVLFVQLAYLHNSINVLRRWIVASRSDRIERNPQFHAAVVQQQLAGRFLAGVLFEGEKVLRKSLFGTQVSRRYADKLSPEAASCQKMIRDYFKKTNAIKAVRNRFAFHFDREDVEARLKELPKDGEFPLYVAEEQGNSLYYLGEEIVGLAMLAAVGEIGGAADPNEALRLLQSEILDLSEAFDRVVAEYLGLMITTNLPSTTWDAAELVDLGDLVPIDEIELPFFVGRPREAG